MAISSIRILQSNLSPNFTGSVLKSGTVVKGRVMTQNPDGSYIVSLAGQKITVRSSVNFTPGSSFSAKVNINNGQLFLSLINESQGESLFVQKFGPEGTLSLQLSQFLTSLGLEANTESLRILQFMQQLGMKIDIPAAKKALNQARKDGKTDRERAEISLLLDEKGLPSDERAVTEIAGRNPGDNPQDEKERQNKQNENADESNQDFSKKTTGKVTKEDIKRYFDQVDSASERKAGILAAFNSIKSSSKKEQPLKHWINLPFEWNFNNYWGNLRFLFDSDLKNLEKVIIDLKNEEKRTIFVLAYKKGNLSSVNFSSSQEFLPGQKKQLSEKLSAMLNFPAVYKSFEDLTGFCDADEELAFVRGTV